MKYKVIAFDIDDTLCDVTANIKDTHSAVYSAVPEFSRVSLEEYIKIVIEEWRNYYKNVPGVITHSRNRMWLNICKRLGVRLSIQKMREIIDIYWKNQVGNTTIYPGVKDTLAKTKKLGYSISAISNGDFYTKAIKLEKINVAEYFDYIFTTELVNKDKNEPDIYKYVIDFLNVAPGEIFYVGDKPDQDILHPKKLGIATCQAMMRGDKPLYKEGPMKPDFVINKFDDILMFI